MIVKTKTTFKHDVHTFPEGVIYEINNKDAKYFLAAGWVEESKGKPAMTIGEMGFDPETKWADTGKKVMAINMVLP